MPNNFYVTTPIYYSNGIPHIWHAYSSLIADTCARYHKMQGSAVKFSTGVDENSQKIVQAAEKAWIPTMDFLDTMADKHQAVWDGLGIEYSDFIRTTESRHHEFVREVLQKSFDNGDIYQWEYEGKYCVGCEAFKKDDDLIESEWKMICPDHLTEPDIIKEKNYFFKLSKYEDKLKKLYADQPDFVMPSDRFNEVKAFVDRWLEDFSISRETNTFGIALPFDESQVTYVWYDALFNYITVCQEEESKAFWPASLHVVGKDIIRFHAIYWPAMLMSAGYELPKNILTTGFFTIDGQKISKSLGNAIDPVEFSEEYSKELLSLYLLSSFHIGQDGDFDREQAILTYNAKLANNLWNLVNRVVVLSLKLDHPLWAWIEDFIATSWEEYATKMSELFPESYQVITETYRWFEAIETSMQNYQLKDALDTIFSLISDLNKFADSETPWSLIKTDPKKAEIILYIIARRLVLIGVTLYPFFPQKMSEMFTKFWLHEYGDMLESGKRTELESMTPAFNITEKWSPLFQRIETK